MLPKDPDVREKWIQFIVKKCPIPISCHIRVCSAHFTSGCFENKSQYDAGFAQKLVLKDRAVPTIFDPGRIWQTVSNVCHMCAIFLKSYDNSIPIFYLVYWLFLSVYYWDVAQCIVHSVFYLWPHNQNLKVYLLSIKLNICKAKRKWNHPNSNSFIKYCSFYYVYQCGPFQIHESS